MRAVVMTKHGGPGVLEVQERPDPELGPGEVRIDVAAAGVNFADVMARLGLYADAPKTPCVVGYEVAGTILELGEGVQGLTAGQRVLIHSAGGGVGIAATQIAKRYGAEVYGTASPGKHERCLELGLDHAVDYT